MTWSTRLEAVVAENKEKRNLKVRSGRYLSNPQAVKQNSRESVVSITKGQKLGKRDPSNTAAMISDLLRNYQVVKMRRAALIEQSLRGTIISLCLTSRWKPNGQTKWEKLNQIQNARERREIWLLQKGLIARRAEWRAAAPRHYQKPMTIKAS
ncbi:MAG: hypothetical protein Q9160_006974 [Pyrenula sp. 1 TL-2023]